MIKLVPLLCDSLHNDVLSLVLTYVLALTLLLVIVLVLPVLEVHSAISQNSDVC